VTQGERLVITNISHDDNILNVLTWQSWQERRAQSGEVYASLVW
jgi:hypothetical protein